MARRNRKNRRVNNRKRRNKLHHRRHHRRRHNGTGRPITLPKGIRRFGSQRTARVFFILSISFLVPSLVLTFVYGFPLAIRAPFYFLAAFFFVSSNVTYWLHRAQGDTNEVSDSNDVERCVSTVSIADSQVSQLVGTFMNTMNEHQQKQESAQALASHSYIQNPMDLSSPNPGPPTYMTPSYMAPNTEAPSGQQQNT